MYGSKPRVVRFCAANPDFGLTALPSPAVSFVRFSGKSQLGAGDSGVRATAESDHDVRS